MATRTFEARRPTLSERADHERDLLHCSLALLESGAARRVTIVGLRFGGLVSELRPEAAAHGISLRGAPRAGRRGRTDVVVEPLG